MNTVPFNIEGAVLLFLVRSKELEIGHYYNADART